MDQNLASIAVKILTNTSTGETNSDTDTVTQEVRTRMRQLPSQLRGSGLTATYAFVLAKAEKEGNEPLRSAYAGLADAIAEQAFANGYLPRPQNDPNRHGSAKGQQDAGRRDFMSALCQASPAQYSRVSAAVDALAVWLSRLAEAYYEPAAGAGDDHGEEQGDR
ncbi:type III-B CRISPR module-associated protein Cmr5 [Nocardiopsis sp. NPDC006938]|uniref:type III-B CRISPR module-associated protein Cmr5 n=1 Tax=Nocardiopsis sp. NPDC006938 TaxID=3364337 RepID=UPI0036BB8646